MVDDAQGQKHQKDENDVVHVQADQRQGTLQYREIHPASEEPHRANHSRVEEEDSQIVGKRDIFVQDVPSFDNAFDRSEDDSGYRDENCRDGAKY